MEKQDVIEKVKELIAAPNAFAPLKEIANEYLKAVGASDEKAKAKALVDALGECVSTTDAVIAFFSTDDGVKAVGADRASAILSHAKELKTKGVEYCDCPACAPGKIILDNKDTIL